MKLVYSRRALAYLNEIASYYAASASPRIAGSIERRLVSVIDRICGAPELHGFRNAPKSAWLRSFAIHFGFSIGCAATQ